MRRDLRDDPSVIGIATITGLDEFSVVGRLHTLWSWADGQSRDGRDIPVTPALLDRYVAFVGFSDALKQVGWLRVGNGSVTFPHFERHNGVTAKTRAMGAMRQSRYRNADRNAPTVTTVTQDALPEESREEESREENIPPPILREPSKSKTPKFTTPTIDEASAYAKTIGLPNEEVLAWFDHFAANGWKVGGKTPMKSWEASLRTWKRNCTNGTFFKGNSNGSINQGNNRTPADARRADRASRECPENLTL